ncbi:MAG: Rieske 2Fe-2S domain-containing protein [Pseudomonadota bacterium]
MQADASAHWVPAAVSKDILDGTVIPAALPSGPIAVWRTATGKIHANGDRCPHRGMRLSHGFVRGESLSCIYHGWRFGKDGFCEHIPAHPNLVPPKSINCGPLPVSEQNGVVWVASVEPASAPKDFSGYDALRSLVFRATPEAIAASTQGLEIDGGLEVTLGDFPAVLLLTERTSHETFVIALISAGTNPPDRLEAAAALEALRRGAEATGLVEAQA